jgi:hypothetical protein
VLRNSWSPLCSLGVIILSACGSACGTNNPAGSGGASSSGSMSGGSGGTGGTGGSMSAVTTYDAQPGILSNQVQPGFCEPELYTKTVDGKTEYWLRDNVAAYGDPRPRSFYVDFGYVGASLDYGPILRGGVYSVRCLRFAGDAWWQQPATMESHVVWFRVPGPMMEPGEVQVPATFQIEDNFIANPTKLLPKFTPIKNKITLVYQWWDQQTLDDIYGQGATHFYAGGPLNEPNPAKLGLTSAMEVNAPWMNQLGVNPSLGNLNGLGEQGFQAMNEAQIDEAAAQQPHTGLFFTDLEKITSYGDPNTYWSINLEDGTLPNYYRLLKAMRDGDPQRLLADYYRNIVWSKGFPSPDDGNPDPGNPKYQQRLTEAETYGVTPPYRKFNYKGTEVSLRDLIDIHTVDAYPGRGWGPFDGSADKSDRSWTSYQLYSMIYDTMVIRKVVPSTTKVLWFGWSQSDNDQATRLYIQLPTGRASYYVRHPQPASWAQTVEMLGNIVGDGYHWWTEQISRGNDPMRLGTGDGAEQWEPSVPNAPAPWTWNGDPNTFGAYPRIHEYALSYGKLGQYQVKQVEDYLSSWSFASYSLPGTPGSSVKGEGAILEVAQNRLPIVLLLGSPGHRALFAVHPFGDYRQRYTLTVDVDGTQTPLTLAGKWPTLVVL